MNHRATFVPARLIAPLALGLVLAGCETPPQVAAPVARLEPPTLAVGDRWTYRAINGYNGIVERTFAFRVEAIGAGGIDIQATASDGAVAAGERYSAAWDLTAETFFDTPIRYESAQPLVPWGTTTGGSVWTNTRYFTPKQQRALRWQSRIGAVGWEMVTVPAGTFAALRIERDIWFEHPDFFRHLSSRSDTLWYVPEVKRWVKRVQRGAYYDSSDPRLGARLNEDWTILELTEFSVAR